MKPLMMLLVSFSLFACDNRPDTTIYGVNAPAGELRGYNMKDDYDKDGNRKPDTKPRILPVSGLADLNKFVCTDPVGYENLVVYGKNMREELIACRKEKSLMEAVCTQSKSSLQRRSHPIGSPEL